MMDRPSDGGGRRAALRDQPAEHLIALAIEASVCSPCRSKRGSVIFIGPDLITRGFNYKPRGFDCDGSAACKKTCRIEAIHAEQQALLLAGRKADGAEMLHVKTVDGKLVPSGGPSCAQCSKLALVAGIKAMWLFHDSGWRRYEAAEWHRLSLLALLDGPAIEPAENYDWKKFCVNHEGFSGPTAHCPTCQKAGKRGD